LVAQALPHVNDPWCQDPAHRVRIEFLYSTTQPQLAIRVITYLPYSDGVTAVRAALHTLEALEGGKVAVGHGGEAFKKNPPFFFGPKHVVRLMTVLGNGVKKALRPFTRPVSAAEAAAPTTANGLRAYYSSADAKPAAIRWYCVPAAASPNATYKALLAALQAWADRVGWKGFFNLLNFSPLTTPSIVATAADLASTEKRYAGVFAPVAGPVERLWQFLNYILVEVSVFFVWLGNNSSRSHPFTWCTPSRMSALRVQQLRTARGQHQRAGDGVHARLDGPLRARHHRRLHHGQRGVFGVDAVDRGGPAGQRGPAIARAGGAPGPGLASACVTRDYIEVHDGLYNFANQR